MRRGFKTWAEDVALELRRVLGLRAEEPLLAQVLAKHLGANIITLSDIPGVSHDLIHQLTVVEHRVNVVPKNRLPE